MSSEPDAVPLAQLYHTSELSEAQKVKYFKTVLGREGAILELHDNEEDALFIDMSYKWHGIFYIHFLPERIKSVGPLLQSMAAFLKSLRFSPFKLNATVMQCTNEEVDRFVTKLLTSEETGKLMSQVQNIKVPNGQGITHSIYVCDLRFNFAENSLAKQWWDASDGLGVRYSYEVKEKW
jgi:hypothetical protein